MRELYRVVFHRSTLFFLLLLTAIGTVLFWLHTKDSVVAKDYPGVFTSVYHGLLEEYKDIPPEEISEDELKNRADTAAAAGVIAYLYRTYGMDDELMEMLELYPEFQEDLESGILRKYMDDGFDQRGYPRGNLLQVPSVLYRPAESCAGTRPH